MLYLWLIFVFEAIVMGLLNLKRIINNQLRLLEIIGILYLLKRIVGKFNL